MKTILFVLIVVLSAAPLHARGSGGGGHSSGGSHSFSSGSHYSATPHFSAPEMHASPSVSPSRSTSYSAPAIRTSPTVFPSRLFGYQGIRAQQRPSSVSVNASSSALTMPSSTPNAASDVTAAQANGGLAALGIITAIGIILVGLVAFLG